MSRYDDMSERARFYLENNDEIELAEMVASYDARIGQLKAALDRVRALADDCAGPRHRGAVGIPHSVIADVLREALEPPKETP